ncbi:MAG TPA: pyridoxal phosphate-dependent aminotransferase [Bryobacteraceae bacterium]|nr:pyridoxal phosphate-dependent aminotransferase [Bryobacteraceae bacterium]
MNTHLSWYGAASTQPSPVNRMMAAFTSSFRDGIDINLGVGFVNEQTIPVAAIERALQAVAADQVTYRQAFNYGSSTGTANLIAAIRRFLLRSRLGQIDAATLDRNRVIIGPCGATSLLDGLAAVLKQGIVVTSDPMYYIYSDALERNGFEVLAVPEDSEGISLEALDRKLRELGDRADEISFFYIVTVNNPSCTILSNARRRALYDVAARLSRQQGRQVPIFFDLAYEWLLHDPAIEPLTSVLPQDELGIAYEIGTLSKVIAPALRVGYLLGPDGPVVHAMIQKTSDTGFSAPPFVQEMAAWLLDNGIEEQLRAVKAGYREKALAVRAAIDQNLGAFLEDCRGGSAGFYFYLTMRDIETRPGSTFFHLLAEAPGGLPRIIYIPGEYCVHPRGDLAAAGRRQLRLSYGFEQTPAILRALGLMREAIPRRSGTLA